MKRPRLVPSLCRTAPHCIVPVSSRPSTADSIPGPDQGPKLVAVRLITSFTRGGVAYTRLRCPASPSEADPLLANRQLRGLRPALLLQLDAEGWKPETTSTPGRVHPSPAGHHLASGHSCLPGARPGLLRSPYSSSLRRGQSWQSRKSLTVANRFDVFSGRSRLPQPDTGFRTHSSCLPARTRSISDRVRYMLLPA